MAQNDKDKEDKRGPKDEPKQKKIKSVPVDGPPRVDTPAPEPEHALAAVTPVPSSTSAGVNGLPTFPNRLLLPDTPRSRRRRRATKARPAERRQLLNKERGDDSAKPSASS